MTPFTNTKDSLEELDFDRPICMAAICFINPIRKISTDIAPLL